MSPSLATLVYVCGIAGLFYLDRDKSIRTSKALWLPVIYLWVLGSRPVSFWLGVSPPGGTDIQLEGSPVDAAFFAVLLIAAICVLAFRGRRVLALLHANFPIPILIYFAFCLVSICWSGFPGPALKKWIKAIGDLAMILIVVTDEHPVAALRRLFSRTAFILMPVSLLFIKYYPYLGRAYDQWTGLQMNTGATSDKNMLGVITFVLSLGVVWRVVGLLRSEEAFPRYRRHLLAQGAILVIGILLLIDSNSVTSGVSFTLGAGLILLTSLRFIRRKPAALHILVMLLVMIAGLIVVLGGETSAAHALGRNSNLTGRTDIWAAVIPMAPNPLLGAGFESFWLIPSVKLRLAEIFQGLILNEAHNGYIEVYLNLGWVGLGLMGVILIDGYRRSVRAFRRDPTIGCLLVAYVLTALTYNVTEAGFRMMHPNWIFFLLAVIEASSVAASVSAPSSLARGAGSGPEARNTLAMRTSGRIMRVETKRNCGEKKIGEALVRIHNFFCGAPVIRGCG